MITAITKLSFNIRATS